MDVSDEKIPIIVIAGPTASGKSALAVGLALLLDAEVVSADSMQIYKGLDVGCAKLTEAERRGVRHHMIDVIEPDCPYSVADYVKAAGKCISDISARGKVPILCGGTGLYISSLIGGVKFTGDGADLSLRAGLFTEYEKDGGKALMAELERADPEYAKKVHVNNKVRLVRAVEIIRNGVTPSRSAELSAAVPSVYSPVTIVLRTEDRAGLYRRIDTRVSDMLSLGLLGEAKYVYANRHRFKTASQAIGYKEFFPFFEGESDLAFCTGQLKQSTRRYAKRQITWFKRMENAVFADIETVNVNSVMALIKKHWIV